MDSQPVKRRRRTTKHEQAILEELYAESRTPSLESRLRVCQAIGFEMRALCIWLQNRRQKEKKDAGKWKPSYSATGELQAGNTIKPSSTYTSSSASHTRTSSPAVSSLAASTSSSEQDELADDNEGEQALAQPHAGHSHTPPYHASSLQASTASPSIHLDMANNNNKTQSRDHQYTRTRTSLALSHASADTSTSIDMNTSMNTLGYAPPVDLPVRTLAPKRVVSQQQQQPPQFQQTQDHALDDTSELMTGMSSIEARSSAHQDESALHADVAVSKQTKNAAPAAPAPPVTTTTHAAQPLRRTTSSYSLCIASDGKATMTAVPAVVAQEPHQASATGSTTTAIIPASAELDMPSRPTGHGHVQQGRPVHRLPSLSAMLAGQLSSFQPTSPSSSSSSGRAFSTTALPASASLVLSPSKSSASSQKSRFARVQSQPCLSGLSTSVSSPRRHLAYPQARPSIFSPAAVTARGSSYSNSNANANHTHTTRVVKAELWDKLDSDPLEPEDEIASSRTRRALASPVRRQGALTMEDVLSTSRKAQRRQLQHPYAALPSSQTHAPTWRNQQQALQEKDKKHHARDLSASASPEKARPPRAELSGPAPVARRLGPRFGEQKREQQREQQPVSQMLALRGRASAVTSAPSVTTMSGNMRPPLLHRSNTAPDAIFSRANTLARPYANVHHTIENMGPAPINAASSAAGIIPLCSQTRKRGYSRSMLVRTVSLDRVMLLDDSADEDDEGHASHSHSHSRPAKKMRRSRPGSTFPPTTATTTGMSELGSSPCKSDAESGFSTTIAGAGNSSLGSAMLIEPELSFSSNEASLSFDALSSRGDISEVDTEADGVDIHDYNNDDRVRRMTSSSQTKRTSTAAAAIFSAPPSARTILSPTSKSTAPATAATYHALAPNSPCKSGNLNGITWINGSPTKNGKILTDMERDCAAVLMGLVGGGGE